MTIKVAIVADPADAIATSQPVRWATEELGIRFSTTSSSVEVHPRFDIRTWMRTSPTSPISW